MRSMTRIRNDDHCRGDDRAILRWQDFTGEKATLDGRSFAEVKDARCDRNCDMAEGVAIASEAVPPREGCMAHDRTLR
jgi:hypothetical protein